MTVRFLMAAAGLMLVGTYTASAAEYRLEIIAQAGDVIEGRTIDRFSFDPTNVAINNDGEIAFFAHATGPEGSGWSLMTQRRFIAGAGRVVDGYVPGFNDEDHTLDMNERGDVVYTPILAPGHRGVFVNEELIFQVGDVIDGRTINLVGRAPQINNLGDIVVEAWYEGHTGAAIFTPDRLVTEFGQRLGDYTLGDMYWPKINDAGDINLIAGLIERDVPALVSPSRILLAPGDVLGQYSVTRVDGVGGIADDGRAIVHAIANGPAGVTSVILVGDEILWTSDQSLAGVDTLGLAGSNIVVNDAGELAVLAAIDTGGGTFDRGILAADTLIIRDGDMLDGKVVARVKANFDMNDRGDVAFRVRFDDETEAVVLATRAVPEPSSIALLFVACAAMAIGHLWRRAAFCKSTTSSASSPCRGDDLSQDRQSGGVSCVCRYSIVDGT